MKEKILTILNWPFIVLNPNPSYIFHQEVRDEKNDILKL